MAGHIAGVSSMATRRILAELAVRYEKQTGRTVSIAAMGGVDAAKAIRAGATTDVVILAAHVMAQLEAEGHIVSGSRADFALSGIAMAVRAGSPHPVIDDEDAVKQAMLNADKICFSTGPSGDHLMQLWRRWGLIDAILPRTLQAPAGMPVGELVARGEADLGFQQLSELLDCPGIDIVGSLPADIQSITVFSAGISRSSADPDIARTLLVYLISPETAAVKQHHGMEPPR